MGIFYLHRDILDFQSYGFYNVHNVNGADR